MKVKKLLDQGPIIIGKINWLLLATIFVLLLLSSAGTERHFGFSLTAMILFYILLLFSGLASFLAILISVVQWLRNKAIKGPFAVGLVINLIFFVLYLILVLILIQLGKGL